MDTVQAIEIWRPVEGYPYEVSNLGRVRRTVATISTWAGRVLRPRLDPKGYRRVKLCRDGAYRQVTVAIVVCEAFHGARPPGLQVRHLNGVPDDDRASNLAWGTAQQNTDDKWRHGTVLRGDTHPRSRLSSADVAAIRATYRAWGGRAPRGAKKELARRYGVVSRHIGMIIEGKLWRDVGS